MRLILVVVLTLSLFSCKKTITDNGHGRMCTYTCSNATLSPQISGTKEELDTILVKTYNLNSSFANKDLVDTKYYYNPVTGDIRLAENREYEIIAVADTFRITGIQFEPARQAYILCADHCTLAATSVTVNGVIKKPSVSERDVYTFQIN